MSSIHCVGKDDLELLMFLSLYPKGFDYTCMLPCFTYVVLGVKPEALCMLDKLSAIEPYSKPMCNLMSFVLLKVIKA